MNSIDSHCFTFEYSLFQQDGKFIESSIGKNPVALKTGAGATFPKLENEIAKLNPGESKRIHLSYQEAYGPISSEFFKEFPLEAIPEAARMIGRKVTALSPNGREEIVDVVDIHDNRVILNFNHPLAGKDLFFDIQILSKTSSD